MGLLRDDRNEAAGLSLMKVSSESCVIAAVRRPCYYFPPSKEHTFHQGAIVRLLTRLFSKLTETYQYLSRV